MDWLSANYKWLFSGVGGATLLLFIGWLFRSKASPPASSVENNPTQTVSPSMDNSATQTSSPRMEQHQHFHFGSAPQTPVEPQPRRPAPESATLSPLRAREVFVYDDRYGVWSKTPNNLQRGHKGIVLPFKNVPKGQGQRTPSAEHVSASLEFKNADGSDEKYISHGVWVGHFQHSSTFKPSETHALLVALKRGESFVTLENPNAYDLIHGGVYFRSRAEFGYPQMKEVWKEGTVEIVLVDGHGVTMFQGVFDYQLSGEKMALAPKQPSSTSS